MLESLQICFWKDSAFLQRQETDTVKWGEGWGIWSGSMSNLIWNRSERLYDNFLFWFNLSLKFTLDNEGPGPLLFVNALLIGILAWNTQICLFFFHSTSQNHSCEKGNQWLFENLFRKQLYFKTVTNFSVFPDWA